MKKLLLSTDMVWLWRSNRGQSLVELLLAIGVTAVIFPALLTGIVTSREGRAQQNERIAATALLKETEEEVRSVRENGWTTFASYGNGIFHPAASSGTWILVPGAEVTVDGFTRQVTISDVYRDLTDTIVQTGGTLDPSTKKITATVSWTQPYSSSMTATNYLTRFRDNMTHVETTVNDFNKGISSGTAVVATPNSFSGDGQVQLAAGGAADWCKPSLSVNYYSLVGNSIGMATYSIPGASPGQANYSYITTGGNAASNPLYSLGISDPPYPTPPAVTASQSNNDNVKGYKLFASGSYIYFTTDHPNLAVDIINASNFTKAGYFDDGNNGSVTGENTSVYIAGNVGYVTSDPFFFTFDVSTINGSSSQKKLGSVNLANSAKGNKVIVSGGYAFIATTSTTSQLQIINVQNPNSPGTPITLNVGNNQSGVDLAVSSNYVYLVTNYASATQPDFFVIDISNPLSPKVVGSATTTGGMNPTGVAITPGNVVIVVGAGGDQYQVFNIQTPANPFQCGKLTNPNGATQINAISSIQEADGEVYSYILTTTGTNSNQQFMIIAGGPGGKFMTTGTFTSATFVPGYQTAFNHFASNYQLPSSATTLKLQVASAPVGSDNTCGTAVFTFIGPDSGSPTGYSTNGYFTNIGSGIVPFGSVVSGYQNPGSCFRYKVFLETTDSNQTPVFNDITINYSP